MYNQQPNLTTLNVWYTHEEYLTYLEREHTESVTARSNWRANEDVRIAELHDQTRPINQSGHPYNANQNLHMVKTKPSMMPF